MPPHWPLPLFHECCSQLCGYEFWILRWRGGEDASLGECLPLRFLWTGVAQAAWQAGALSTGRHKQAPGSTLFQSGVQSSKNTLRIVLQRTEALCWCLDLQISWAQMQPWGKSKDQRNNQLHGVWPARELFSSATLLLWSEGPNTCINSNNHRKGLMTRGWVHWALLKTGASQIDRKREGKGGLLAVVTPRKSGWEQWQHWGNRQKKTAMQRREEMDSGHFWRLRSFEFSHALSHISATNWSEMLQKLCFFLFSFFLGFSVQYFHEYTQTSIFKINKHMKMQSGFATVTL